MAAGSHRGCGVFSQIESRHRGWLFRFPVANAKFTVLALLQLRASGDKVKLAGPADGQVVVCKVRGTAEMGVPAFAGANEQNAVSRVLDYIAEIVKLQRKFLILRRSSRHNHSQIIVSACVALLQVNAYILNLRRRIVNVTV